MPTTSAQERVCNDYARKLIKFKAHRIARRDEFDSSDKADIEQDIWLFLLGRAERFDPARASLNTFISRVVDTAAARLIRHRNSVFPMRRKAGRESPGAIDQPNQTVFGTAIPNHYYDSLSERMLTNGLFARNIVFESGPRSKGREPRIIELPPRVLKAARWWADFRPGTGNLNNWHPIPAVVECDDAARAALAEARQQADLEYEQAERRCDAVATTVWGRAVEHTRKPALVYAVSENHRAPVIGKAAVDWAARLVMHQTRRSLHMVGGHVADTPFDAECLKLLRKLGEAPEHCLPHSVLLKRMKMDATSFLDLVKTLEERGDITVAVVSGAGRHGRAYRLVE